MATASPRFLDLPDGRRIAYRHTAGRPPGIVFCGGFTSDMTGTKASALEAHCRARGRAYTRFDYTGHGASSGAFQEGTIGGWLSDALAVIDHVTNGPLVVAGSSMGGWIMLRAALARPERVCALVGIAAAPDFTEDLARNATPQQREHLARQGCWMQPSAYGEEPYPISAALLDEGRRHLVLQGTILITCPVHLLHGQRDPDVPWQTSLKLAECLASEEVTTELIKAGDHRLSRERDLARIIQVIERLASGA